MTEIKHENRAHAVLSASASHRWLSCTPSVRLEEQFPDSTSDFAREGTLAHEIAELKLRKHFTEPMSQRTFNTRMNKFKKHELYQDEVQKHTDAYLEYLQKIAIGMPSQPYVAVEKRIDYSSYAPDGFGTVDCLIIGGDTLYVTDFKYGKGVPVSAEDNPQMKLYALGAYLAYSFLYPITNIHLAIIQPRLDSISEFTLSRDELLAWGESIRPVAEKAYKGEGEFVPGEHCKFCRAKAQCRARADQFTPLDDFGEALPPLLSDEEIGEVLEIGVRLEAWVKALKEYALSACLQGKDIPGWKAVEGRGSRSFVDQDEAFKWLAENDIPQEMLFERVPLTVAKLEKQMGKTQFRSLLEEAGHVVKSTGKPTLAPVTDKRQAVTLAPDAASDFS